ncbi:uncharacterized protein LOC132554726 [Ylistrum balloti]|uniref:uncharacterized protein LOC132554726 n=1 Tax=Ylistrum balloti TaxID=509963 RepID=UPI002905D48D|nr:uncharacterized protein LOC132554726 [Ylistrum balloti]
MTERLERLSDDGEKRLFRTFLGMMKGSVQRHLGTSSILLQLILLMYMTEYARTECPQSSMTGPLKYSKDMNNATFAYIGEQISLDCCITGFVSLAWSFRATENDTWDNIGGTSIYRLKENTRNQTLLIVPPDQDDGYPLPGYYRCIATNAQNDIIVRQIDLAFAASSGRVHPQAFGPSSNTCAKLGKTIAVNCSADFGQLGSSEWNVQWYKDDEGNLSLVRNDAYYPVYEITINNGTNGFIIHQLIISNVTESDITKTFRCYVSSIRESSNKNFMFVVKLCSKVVQGMPVKKETVIGVTAGLVVVFILIIAVVIVVVWLYKPQIHYKLMKFYERNRNKRQVPENENLTDVFIHHSNDGKDIRLASSLEMDLMNEKYSLKRLEAGAPEGNHITESGILQDLILTSAALVVVAPSDNSDEEFTTKLQNVLGQINSNDTVTVICHEDERNENSDLKRYEQLTYEPQGSNRRKRRNFLCAIKLRIDNARKLQQRTARTGALLGMEEIV